MKNTSKKSKPSKTKKLAAKAKPTLVAIRHHIEVNYTLLLSTAFALLGPGTSKDRPARVHIETHKVGDGSWRALVCREYGNIDVEGYVTLNPQRTARDALYELDALVSAVITHFYLGFAGLTNVKKAARQ